MLNETYFYRHQPFWHGPSDIAPPPPIAFFGDSPLAQLVREASKELAGMGKNTPFLPHVFGWKKKVGVKNEQEKMEWIDVEKSPYIADFSQTLHLMLSGVTGKGKSNAIKQWLLSLMYFAHSETLRVHLFDPKGDFFPFEKIAHFNSFEFEKPRKIISKILTISCLMAEKQAFLKKSGYFKIEDFNEARRGKKLPPMKYDVVVVDEFVSLADQVEEVRKPFIHIMEKGRSAGVYLFTTGQRLGAEEFGGKTFGGRAKANILWNWSFAQRDSINTKLAGVESANKSMEKGTSVLSSPDSIHEVGTVLVDDETLSYALKKFLKLGKIFK